MFNLHSYWCTKKYCRKGYIFCSIFLSIAKAMVYHQTFGLDIIAVGVYHQPQVVSFRNDDMPLFEWMICNFLRN